MQISSKKKLETNSESLNNFLSNISIPSLSETQKQICEEELTEKDIYEPMISFDNNKLPGNDGLTMSFMRHSGKMKKTSFSNHYQNPND